MEADVERIIVAYWSLLLDIRRSGVVMFCFNDAFPKRLARR